MSKPTKQCSFLLFPRLLTEKEPDDNAALSKRFRLTCVYA